MIELPGIITCSNRGDSHAGRAD